MQSGSDGEVGLRVVKNNCALLHIYVVRAPLMLSLIACFASLYFLLLLWQCPLSSAVEVTTLLLPVTHSYECVCTHSPGRHTKSQAERAFPWIDSNTVFADVEVLQ